MSIWLDWPIKAQYGCIIVAGLWFSSCSASEPQVPKPVPVRAEHSDHQSLLPSWLWSEPLPSFDDLRPRHAPPLPRRPYTLEVMRQNVEAIPIEIAALTAIGIYSGLAEWHWGKQPFKITHEGWFGRNTYSGGADKVGHAYAAYVISDVLAWRLRVRGFNDYESAMTGAIVSWLMMAMVEVGDGFSQYGASPEDLAMDTIGVGFSVLRNTVPGTREKLDFRMEYIPSRYETFDFWGTDYSGKKWVLALKLAGFAPLRESPWRFVELHFGYYTRGYSDREQQLHLPKVRVAYTGLGLNLSEILFSQSPVHDSVPGTLARSILEYVQVPYTYVATNGRR